MACLLICLDFPRTRFSSAIKLFLIFRLSRWNISSLFFTALHYYPYKRPILKRDIWNFVLEIYSYLKEALELYFDWVFAVAL